MHKVLGLVGVIALGLGFGTIASAQICPLQPQAQADPTCLTPTGNSARQANPGTQSTLTLNLDGYQMLGSEKAPMTVVEFADYQCPACRGFHLEVFDKLKKDYIDTGKLRFYTRDLPFNDAKPDDMRATEAARCAGEQGKYWEMRDVMITNPDRLQFSELSAIAGKLGIQVPGFQQCVESQRYKAKVEADLQDAMKMRIEGTPMFIIGKSTPKGVEGERFEGAHSYIFFDTVLSSYDTPALAPK